MEGRVAGSPCAIAPACIVFHVGFPGSSRSFDSVNDVDRARAAARAWRTAGGVYGGDIRVCYAEVIGEASKTERLVVGGEAVILGQLVDEGSIGIPDDAISVDGVVEGVVLHHDDYDVVEFCGLSNGGGVLNAEIANPDCASDKDG